MILLARTTPLEEVKKPSEGLSLFFMDLDKSAPGLELRKIKKMGGRAVDANEVFFDNYRVPADSLVGEEGQGFKIVRLAPTKKCFTRVTEAGLGSPWHERRALSFSRRSLGTRICRTRKSSAVC